jgi:hypothetical protein
MISTAATQAMMPQIMAILDALLLATQVGVIQPTEFRPAAP